MRASLVLVTGRSGRRLVVAGGKNEPARFGGSPIVPNISEDSSIATGSAGRGLSCGKLWPWVVQGQFPMATPNPR
jgi:hypothetical protein